MLNLAWRPTKAWGCNLPFGRTQRNGGNIISETFDNGMIEMSLWRQRLGHSGFEEESQSECFSVNTALVWWRTRSRPISEQNNERWLLLQCPSLSIWLCLDTLCTQSKPYHCVHPAHCQFPDPSSSAGWSPLPAHPNPRPGLQKREENVRCWFMECKHKTSDKREEVSVPEI